MVNAQQNAPHIAFVYPAGGRQGTTFRVQVGGQFLEGVSGAHISGDGIQAKVIELTKPLPAQKTTELREHIQELQRNGKDPAVAKEIAETRETIASNLNRNANPAFSQRVILELTLTSDAKPGNRELRLLTAVGLSNPLNFCVGQLPEYLENASKDSRQDITDISLPATVNGQLIPGSFGQYRLQVRQQQTYLPGDVDRYRFAARKGQHIVAAATARELIPYLADAVPGWLQAVLAIYDSAGNEVAFNDDFEFHPDPVLHYDIPRDGDYILEIRDALYRGREDFVYRISIGELPFITNIFPLGNSAGTKTKIDIQGWNLPASGLDIDTADFVPGIHAVSVRKGLLISNLMPFQVDTLPEAREKEPNDSLKKAQQVELPVIVNGHIDRPGDQDVYSFKGHSGDEFVAEIYARRLESPLDSVLRLVDATGKQLEFNDDHEDKGSGLETHHADSYLKAILPADGTYYVSVFDAQNHGGPEYGYRLRMSPPRPDFDLRIVPSALNTIVGPTVPITVYALRKDGFSGEITLRLEGNSKGFTLSGSVIPAGQEKARLTLTVRPGAAKEPLSISFEGHAQIQGKDIARTAVPADDLMQAFAYRHLVPAKDLELTAAGRGPNQAALKIMSELPLTIPAGGTAHIQIVMPVFGAFENIEFDLNEPPDGISIKSATVMKQNGKVSVQCDAGKVKPGLKGNLILTISGQRTPAANADSTAANRRQRIPLGTLPAIPFEVITGESK